MSSHTVHICSFQAGPDVTRRMTYKEFREAVLRAGRFSVFEATVNQRTAGMYDTLCKDPTVKTTPIGFPWTKVEAVNES